MALVLNTAPAEEPLTTDEAKNQTRVTGSAEDTLIDSFIVAARQQAEHVTRRAFITQTWAYSLDAWPDGDVIYVPKPPLQSISSVKYYGTDDTEYTLSTDDYQVDTDSEPGRIALVYGASWPSTTLRTVNGIVVTFDAGYGDAASDVPDGIIQAMRLMIGHWYTNREAVVVGATANEVPLAAEMLLWQYRTGL